MNEILIQRVNILSFKNMTDLQFNVQGDLLIEGHNGLGKSNILNAIYWCLTGRDLNGESDNKKFINKKSTDDLVDVEVTMNVGKVRRTVKNSSESIYINDIPAPSLKDGEIEIDRILGILAFTLSTFSNKDFRLREFLMNPNYHLTLAPKTMRDIVLKRLCFEGTYQGFVVNKNPLFDELLKKYNTSAVTPTEIYNKLEQLGASIGKSQKELKAKIERYDSALKVMKELEGKYEIDFDLVTKELQKEIEDCKKKQLEYESEIQVLQTGYDSLHEALGSIDPTLKLFETTQKGTNKNTIDFIIDGIEIEQRSTSEAILDSLRMINNYQQAIGCFYELPKFIDKAESIDKLEKIKTATNSQFLATCVSKARHIKIHDSVSIKEVYDR